MPNEEVLVQRDAKSVSKRETLKNNKGVLILYTGGTIGSMPKDINDPDSPQVVIDWETFKTKSPELTALPFRVEGWSMEPPLDSCNVEPHHWQEMADVILQNYGDYEGFVILHGTDSMVYTATALSFMLVNLGKPVIITGAQRTHLFQSRNDGLQNMLTAIELANPVANDLPVIPEVVLFFQQEILRGSRARKLDAAGLRAYTSPNYPPLGKVEVQIHLDQTKIRAVPDKNKTFYVRRKMDPNVVTFDVYPGVQNSSFVERVLQDPKLKGVVIRAFGAGNIPTDPKFLRLFEAATEQGIVVQVVTQCMQGGVALGLYETSAELLDIGLISGTDLSPEAALVKLMIGLGAEDFEDDPQALRQYLETSQVGEQSTSIFTTPLKVEAIKLVGEVDNNRKRMRVSEPVSSDWTLKTLKSVQLRLWKAEVKSVEENVDIEVEVYVNLASEEPAEPTSPSFAGVFRRVPSKKAGILQFDVTNAFSRLVDPGKRPTFTLVVRQGPTSLSFKSAEVALFVDET